MARVDLPHSGWLAGGGYLTPSVFKAVLQRSTPPKNRQLIIYCHLREEYVDEFVGELTFAKRLYKHFV